MAGPGFKFTQGNGDSVLIRQESTRRELTRFGQKSGHRFKPTRKEMEDSERTWDDDLERTWDDDPAGANPV